MPQWRPAGKAGFSPSRLIVDRLAWHAAMEAGRKGRLQPAGDRRRRGHLRGPQWRPAGKAGFSPGDRGAQRLAARAAMEAGRKGRLQRLPSWHYRRLPIGMPMQVCPLGGFR